MQISTIYTVGTGDLPRTSKGITDMLLLSLVWLNIIFISNKLEEEWWRMLKPLQKEHFIWENMQPVTSYSEEAKGEIQLKIE